MVGEQEEVTGICIVDNKGKYLYKYNNTVLRSGLAVSVEGHWVLGENLNDKVGS